MNRAIVVRTKEGILVGKPDVSPTAPTHVRGVHEGNQPISTLGQDGARRSTGIAPELHGPLDPRMPKLTPP